MNANAALLRSRPRGRPLRLIETHDALVPALDMLRRSATGLDAIMVLDNVPRHLHVRLAEHVAERPAMYGPPVMAALARSLGAPKLRDVVGMRRAADMLRAIDTSELPASLLSSGGSR